MHSKLRDRERQAWGRGGGLMVMVLVLVMVLVTAAGGVACLFALQLIRIVFQLCSSHLASIIVPHP
jgi:hypothetical protein